MAFCSVTDPAPLLLMMYRHYHAGKENTILLHPPIKFGRQSYYETRTAPYFAVPCRFILSFTQRFLIYFFSWARWTALATTPSTRW